MRRGGKVGMNGLKPFFSIDRFDKPEKHGKKIARQQDAKADINLFGNT
jgi:hypothetical protein